MALLLRARAITLSNQNFRSRPQDRVNEITKLPRAQRTQDRETLQVLQQQLLRRIVDPPPSVCVDFYISRAAAPEGGRTSRLRLTRLDPCR